MHSTHSETQPERIQVEREADFLKIRTERFDRKLGWYTAASLSLHVSQALPLEELLGQIRHQIRNESRGKLLTFPSPAPPSAPALARLGSAAD